MKLKASLLLFGGVFSALLVLGCGGGSTTSGGEQPSEAGPRFMKQFHALCEGHLSRQARESARFVREFGRSHGTEGRPVSHAELEQQLLRVIVPNVVRYIRELGELQPPPGKEALFGKLRRALGRGVEVSKRFQSWIIDDDPEPFWDAREIGIRLGNENCGEP